MAVNKALKWGLGLGTGLAITAAFSKFGKLHTASQLVFDMVKADIVGLDKMYIYVKVTNANPDTVTFNSINTELYFNKINVGRLYYNKPILVAQNSSQVFTFPVILYPAGVLEIATNILKSKAKEGVFTIDGKAFVNNIPVPIKKTIKSW